MLVAALTFSLVLGGRGADDCDDIARTRDGHLILACHSTSAGFPAANGRDTRNMDAWIIRLDPGTQKPVWSTRLGGSQHDAALRLVLDANGDVHVTGITKSADFPVTDGSQYGGGESDGFVAKLAVADGRVLFATFLGGAKADSGSAIAVDRQGRVYVAGETDSPLEGRRHGFLGKKDGFVARIGAGGWTHTFGGAEDEKLTGLAIDPQGNVIAVGYTMSPDLPRAGGVKGDGDAVLFKIAPDGKLLAHAGLGGSGQDTAWGVAIDSDGNIFVAGITDSKNLPTPKKAYQRSLLGGSDAFIARFDTALKLVWATYFGGSGRDQSGFDGHNIAIRDNGEIVLAGITDSNDLPVSKDALQPKFGGGDIDGFVAVLSADGTQARYVSYVGGSGRDAREGVTVYGEALFTTGVRIEGSSVDCLVEALIVPFPSLRPR